jgi:thymidylate kinase
LALFTQHSASHLIEVGVALPALLLAGATAIGARAETDDKGSLAPLIAIVGCDGSGKSTLSADMRNVLAEHRRAEVCYLGLGSGEIGNRIRQWPIIGPAMERALARKAKQTRSKDKTIPGLLTALVVFGFSLLRLRRFRHVLALRRRGVTVITDRYPQTEVAGFYDGPGLSAARAGSPLVAWLAARERRIYEYMASHRPDIVLRLNVDVETAFRRKPDHKPALLAEKVRVTPLLRFQGARIVDLDATTDYEQVRDQAFERVRPVLRRADRAIRTAA